MSLAATIDTSGDPIPPGPHTRDGRTLAPVPALESAAAPFATVLRDLLDAFDLTNEHSRIAEALPADIGELMLVDVLNVMARLGLVGKPVEVRRDMIDPRLLPCLFVESGSGASSVIRTPDSETTTGTAYIFSRYDVRTPLEEKEARKSSGTGWFSTAHRRFRSIFAKLVIISCAMGIVSLVYPLFMMAIYDHVTNSGEALSLQVFVIGAVIAIVLEWALQRLRAHHLAWLASRSDHIVSNRIFSRLIQLPASYVERASVASQVARLRTFEGVREFFVGPVFLALIEIPLMIFALMLLAVIGGALALIPLTVGALYLGFWLVAQPRIREAMYEAAKGRSRTQAHHIEMFDKLQVLRLAGMSDIWKAQFRELSAGASLATFRAQYLNAVTDAGAHGIAMLAGIAVIYFGVGRVQAGDMTAGALFAVILLAWRILSPMHTLLTSMSRMEQLRRSTEQIDRLMDLDTERESAPGLGRLPSIRGQLTFDRVGLRYSSGSDPVFAGLSFHMEPGTMTAIAGANGSGKSTILKLAIGLYRPQAGVVSIDGRDIRQLDPVHLRQSVTYVSQNPDLFLGTIADNLRTVSPFAREEDLWEALEQVNAASAVDAMPLKLRTPIGNGQEALPADLAYSIHLARAFLRPSSLIFLDEIPYAVLNSTAGARVWNRLRGWKGSRTILFVSHREDMMRDADQVVGLMPGGRAIVGSPDGVLRSLAEQARSDRKRVA